MGKESYLGVFEVQLITTIIRLGSTAYGMTIRKSIHERTGRDISIGAVYTTLDRLEKKGMVTSKAGAPSDTSPQRGGRVKRYFQVTGVGADALNQTRAMMETMWDGLAPVGV